ncbi:MAG: hypothetical protein ACOYBP_03350 [Microbacteriaceae bacterium]
MIHRQVSRFDTWMESGPFSSSDLALYRMVYPIVTAASIFGLTWLSDFPSWMWAPQLGPFRLLDAMPSHGALTALEIALRVGLVMLALGLFTRLTSFAVGLLLIVTNGVSFSVGHLDHTIMIAVVPLVMAFSNWGSHFSLDSLIQNWFPPRWNQIMGIGPMRQWPLRILALCVGATFFSSIVYKVAGGWFALDTHATWNVFLRYYWNGIHVFLGPLFSQIQNEIFWEPLDWFTVILEGAVLFSVLRWGAFRFVVACLTVFHLLVMLLVNIPFAENVIAYGAFIIWPLFSQRWVLSASRRTILFSLGAVAVVTTALGLLSIGEPFANRVAINTVVILAAVVGISYIVRTCWRSVRAVLGRQSLPRS